MRYELSGMVAMQCKGHAPRINSRQTVLLRAADQGSGRIGCSRTVQPNGVCAAERGLALGFGVKPTWFSRARLARVLDDSANQKSGRPSAGGNRERLRPMSRVADLALLNHAPRNAHPPSFTGACRHSPAGGPFRNEEACMATGAGPARIADRPFNRKGGCE
jgi:hypothetical protein